LLIFVREGVISVQKAQEYAVYPEEVLRYLRVKNMPNFTYSARDNNGKVIEGKLEARECSGCC
jgi:hypothetical protein